MRIRWHGHSCFEIGGSVVVVTDPHDGKSLGIPPPNVKGDLILVSHDHFDHNCVQLVRTAGSSVISKPIMTVEHGVRVEGITADHDADGGAKRGKVTIFKFEMDGVSFCHLGDLGHELNDSQIDTIAPVDFLFLPVGDVFTVGPQAGKSVADSVAPKVVVPMHYRVPGLGLPIQPVQSFTRLFDQSRVVKVGNEIEFNRDDLPATGTEVWVFSS